MDDIKELINKAVFKESSDSDIENFASAYLRELKSTPVQDLDLKYEKLLQENNIDVKKFVETVIRIENDN